MAVPPSLNQHSYSEFFYQLLSQDDDCKAHKCETLICCGALETRYEAITTVCAGCKQQT